MNELAIKKFNNVCPRNCPSACTMISHVENGRLAHITGSPHNPYTNGKLCAKGFSYLEKNNHPHRLKFPYYQEEKGSGKFKQITWEKAFDLINNEMLSIHDRFGSFLPFALYKGSGNVGVHHFVTNHFFSSIGETTRIIGASSLETRLNSAVQVKMSDPAKIKDASMVIIWGNNPAATNPHLIPFIIEAKNKGAKVVVIDPLYTQTAEIADLYVQLRPSTDGALASLLIKGLLEDTNFKQRLLEEQPFGLMDFLEMIKKIESNDYLLTCDVSKQAIDLLLNWVKEASTIAHIIGLGIQKHSNGEQNIRVIESLAVVHGDINSKGGGIFFRHNGPMIFNNQTYSNEKDRIILINDPTDRTLPSNYKLPIEMMWITCANPLTQEPNPQYIEQFIKDIPFVVTVDHFLTPTAQMSNLVLPTTTHFEEMDIVKSFWHKQVALNERAISPYFESKSEWNIMKQIALRLKKNFPDLCQFPIHLSEEEYLNEQFNDKVFEHYYIKSIIDMKKRTDTPSSPKIVWGNQQLFSESTIYQFYSETAKKMGLNPFQLFKCGETPTLDYPFWLITPHHPYTFNSQFHFLDFKEEGEAFVGIHPKAAAQLGIFDGEIVKVFNEHACVEIKASYSSQVPKDILLIYAGWYESSKINVNHLISPSETKIDQKSFSTKCVSFYDTFVNVTKW